jgi:uroporphyrinogen-III synthase
MLMWGVKMLDLLLGPQIKNHFFPNRSTESSLLELITSYRKSKSPAKLLFVYYGGKQSKFNALIEELLCDCVNIYMYIRNNK